MALKRVRLELARDPEFPEGSSSHGYNLVLPLNEQDHLDPEEWRQRREDCTVERFWGGGGEELGHLRRRPGGGWAFHYDVAGDPEAEETGYRFDSHNFVKGEYLSIREQDGEIRTFRVVEVRPHLVPVNR